MAFLTNKKNIVFVGLLIITVFITSAKLGTSEEVIPFVVAVSNGPSKLDPLDAYDFESIETIMQVVEGLYRYNYSSCEMEVIPCLAQQMGQWSPDMLNLTITLKEGVEFHDGTLFNASAVKWNFDRLQYWTYGFDIDGDGDLEASPIGTASKTLFKLGPDVILNRTEILSSYQFRFILNVPCIIWEKLLAFVACYMVKPDIDSELGIYYGDIFFNRIAINEPLIGTGPFILTEYNLDYYVDFAYNPRYHEPWQDNHIQKMRYLIIPDDEISSMAVLNHEVHWGGVISDYSDDFEADPSLIKIYKKASVVYFIQMYVHNILWEYRYASSFAWNHTHFLNVTLEGRRFHELHVPVPDGMEYHHSGFEGEPSYNLTKARSILLGSSNPQIQANITLTGLNPFSAREEWRNVADSPNPIAWLDYTYVQWCSWGDWGCYGTPSYLDNLVYPQLQDNLKDIGIRLDLKCVCIIGDYLENPDYLSKLGFHASGWGPDYFDPINMIEPLYRTNASSNYSGLNNASWDQKLLDTYSTVGEERRDLFYDIQEDFCTIHVPSFYILQSGGSISFNREYVDENSITDLLNIMSDLYWFNVRFTPPPLPKIPGYPAMGIVIVSIFSITLVIMLIKKRMILKMI